MNVKQMIQQAKNQLWKVFWRKIEDNLHRNQKLLYKIFKTRIQIHNIPFDNSKKTTKKTQTYEKRNNVKVARIILQSCTHELYHDI